MHPSTSILIGAATLGLVGGSIPGPVLTSILTEIIESGFIRSLRVLLFALFVETCVRFTGILLAGVLPVEGAVFQGLSIIGGLILLSIARKVWRIRGIESNGRGVPLPELGLMIVFNGMLWTYWLTVCVPDALRLSFVVPSGSLLYLLVFEAGWLASTFCFACVFASFRSLLTHPRLMPVLFKAFSLVFAGFGLKMLVTSIRYFLSVLG